MYMVLLLMQPLRIIMLYRMPLRIMRKVLTNRLSYSLLLSILSVMTRIDAQGVVVIYTDGRDNAGVYLKEDAVTAAQQSTSYVYSVAFGNNGITRSYM